MKNSYFFPKNFLRLLMTVMVLTLGVFTAQAQVRVGFTQRTSSYTPTKKIYNIKGNFTMLGNTALTPQNYSNTTNNNGQYMTYVDYDGDPNTFNSSAATLTLSNENGALPSCSNIVFAGLYWTGVSSANMTFPVTKNIPVSGTVPVNQNLTIAHNQNINNSNYSLSVLRNDPSNNNRNPYYNFTGNGNTYRFNFFNSGANPRVSLQVNGGSATNVPVTVSADNTTATLNTPYVITDGTVQIQIKKLIRSAATNLSASNTQSTSFAEVTVVGTVTGSMDVTKTYDKRVISLKGPGQSSYTQFTAAPADIYYPSGTDDNLYSGYVEVTDYVRTHGIGQYWAADLALLEGNFGGTGYAGGWGMIVVYENSKMKWRDVTVFDGYAYVNSGNNNALNLPVTGFNTVQSGNVGMTLGIMAGEGDVSFTGDYFRVQKLASGNYQTLNHSGNSATNFFNSSINAPGARTPQLQNNTAIDIAMVDVPNPNNTVIGNNQTSTNFQYGTDGDTYSIFAIAMAVDAYIPESEGNIAAVTINGQPAGAGPYNATPGQDMTFKIQVRNRGTEPINNFKVTVPVPYNTDYVAGSAGRQIFFTPTPSPNTIAFEPTTGAHGSVVWNLGTLPLPANGNPETILGEMSFTFKVTTDCTILKNTNCTNVVDVNGTMNGTGAITGIAMGNKNLIQGYTNNGSCTGVEVPAPLRVNVNAIEYVNQNCQAVPPITAFYICNSTTTIPITEVTGAFPAGSTFWSSYPVVSGQTVQYTINNPFPSIVGTSTYYAIPPGTLTGCYFQFTITVTTVTTQPTVSATPVNYCVGATAVPLTATPSVAGYTLYYYASQNGPAQMSITPATDVAGQFIYYVAEAQSSTCIGPKKQIVVNVYPLPTITAPAATNVSGCNPNAISGLPFSTTPVTITLAQLQTAGGNVPNASAIGNYTITYQDVASGTNPVTVTRTFSVTNICGTAVTATQVITVRDTTAPVVPTLANVTGQCSATVTPPTTTDACAGTITGTTTSPLTYNTQGTFVVTWTFDDGNGNTSTATQTVIVDDTIAPVVPVLAAVEGQCSATVPTPTTTDNCAGTITATTTDPLVYNNQGDYVITWTFNDGNGNTSTATQNVHIHDTVSPIVDALPTLTGQCSVTAVPPFANDACSDGFITATTNDPLTYTQQGTYIIHWRFVDGSGNVTLAEQTVIVQDTQAPVAPTLANVTGQCSATVTPPTAQDNCRGAIIGTTTDPLTYNTQGTFIVHWTFNDNNGNITTANQTVIVQDTTAPVVPTLANVTGQCSATVTPPTTTDNCAGTITATTTSPLTYTQQGTYTITWTFADGNGNSSTATQTVIVQDTAAPVLPTLANVTGQCSATVTPPTAQDACSGAITATTTDPLTYNTQGTYIVHWTFNDGHGNVSTVNQTVIVDDTIAPVAPVLANVTGQCSASVTPPVAQDNCAGSITATTTDPLTYNTQGTFVVTWTFNDGNGNTSTATQTVIVDDTTAPTIPVLADVTGQCSATVTPPTTTDACAGTITGTTTSPLTYNTQGTFVITWTFNDGNGNVVTANQNVIINNNVAPSIPTLNNVVGQCSATVPVPSTTNSCSGAVIVATTTDPLTYTQQGTYIVHWTFNDGNGNIVTANQTVIVDDTVAPTVPTLANVTGQCSATATPPVTTDACAGTITGTTTDPLTYNTQGTFVITWTFNDGNGNTSTATQTVIVDDTVAPVIPALANVTGQCSATVTPPVAQDACAGAITATTTDPLTYNTQGTYTVTWTFNDGNGNTSTATQTVIVDDTTAPVVPTLANVTGQCSATVTPPTTTDNCAGTLTATTTDPLTYTTQGTFIVTWTFNDGNGNTSTATQTVIVDDTVAPVVPVLADVTGQCSVTLTAPTTTDGCNPATIVGTTQDPTTYTQQGTYVVTWSFNDGNGNISTAMQNVIVDDTTAPVIPVLADVTGQCSATVPVPTTTDNCTAVITGTTTDPLSYNTQGTFVVTWTFNDGNGNTVTATQNVIVDNTVAPTAPVLADITGQCSATVPVPTTTNSCTGATIFGTTTDPLTYTAQGTYVVTWTFDDGNGNIITGTQNVIVDDTTAPIAPVLADVTGQCSATVTPPTAQDNCSATAIVGTTTDPLTYTTQGTFVVTWTFDDGNGNITTATQNVIVDDTQAPEVPVLADVTGQCSATVTAPATTDGCSATPIIGTTTDPLTYDQQGTYTVTWTFDDGNGNVSTATQTVIVDDTIAPIIPVLADVVGQCSATVPVPTTTDNCAVTVTGTTTDPLSYDQQGTYVVTWTFNDGNGNTVTATQNVIIDNTVAPNVPVLADITGQCSATVPVPSTANSCSGATIFGTTTDPLSYDQQGSYVVTWSFDDGNGNIITATQNVIVDDTTAPVVPVLADVTGACSATVTPPTTTDNCAGTLTATTADPLAYDQQGTYVITWVFDDGNGNFTTVTQNVIVDDVTPPTAPVLADVTGECSATVTAPEVQDNCSATTIVGTTTDPLSYDQQGTYVVTWTFDDGNGNITTATQNVIVDDVTAPVAPVLADVTGECSATVTAPTTTDNCAGTLTATTTDPLSYDQQGTFVVTWTFDDGNGNITTATQNVIVDDVTAPVAPVLADVTAQCQATVTPPTTTDNCAGTITATTTDPLSYDQQGTFVITWTFDDGNGNITTATQNVIINNNVPPTAPVLADITGECSATVPVPTVNNSCTGAAITGTTTDPLSYDQQGTYVVTWTFDDGNGNIITATQNVIVDDVTAPVAPVLADVTGACSATVTAPTTTDNCSGTLTATTTDPLSYDQQGTYVVTWTFDDGNGNIITATQNVIVDDVTAPVIPVLADVTGACSATVTPPTASDDCAGTITATTTDPLIYNTQGTFVVTWTFDDGNGNITTATQNVIVDDVTAPVVPVLANVTGACSATVTPPTTTDDCAGTITATTTDPLTYNTQGTFVVTWTFDDGNGNVSTATQNVIVDDVTAPVVPVLANVTGACSATVTPPTASDDCAGTITATTTDPLSYNTQGTFVVTWTFDDGNGNVSTATQTVIVSDTTAPTVPVIADATGECSVTVTAPSATDGCSSATIIGTTTDPTFYDVQGTYVITWSFNDGNGNISTATQNVIVDDVTAPAVPTLANVTGQCSATVTPPTTTDNCAGTLTGTTTDPLTYNTQGTFIVHWTFNDGNGNTIVVNQTVVVDDTVAPSVPVLADVTGNCSVTITAPVAPDTCAGNITATTTDPYTYGPGTYTVTWTFDDGNGNVTTAVQTVIVTDGSSTSNASGYLKCNTDIALSLDLDTLVTTLPAGGVWTDLSATGHFDQATGFFNPQGQLAAGTYNFQYEVTDGACSSTVLVAVQIDSDCDVDPAASCEPIVHNAFSPNNDGINEWFQIDNFGDLDCVPTNTVEIYNRWGILVFETKQYDNNSHVFRGKSEGRVNVGGEDLPTGTYFYIINYTYDASGTGAKNYVSGHKEGYLYLSK